MYVYFKSHSIRSSENKKMLWKRVPFSKMNYEIFSMWMLIGVEQKNQRFFSSWLLFSLHPKYSFVMLNDMLRTYILYLLQFLESVKLLNKPHWSELLSVCVPGWGRTGCGTRCPPADTQTYCGQYTLQAFKPQTLDFATSIINGYNITVIILKSIE